jgi:hypothetical protein
LSQAYLIGLVKNWAIIHSIDQFIKNFSCPGLNGDIMARRVLLSQSEKGRRPYQGQGTLSGGIDEKADGLQRKFYLKSAGSL